MKYDITECIILMLYEFFQGNNVKKAWHYFITRIPVAIFLIVLIIATGILFEYAKEEHRKLLLFVLLSWTLIVAMACIYRMNHQ